MDNEWHDIKDIDEFKEYYEFNDFVAISIDEDDGGEYRDLYFGIKQIPKSAIKFFCVPCEEE